MKDIVIFHLSKHFPPLTPIRPYLHCAETLYEQIKNGKKTSEWRDFSKYWTYRLCHAKRSNHLPAALVFNIVVNGTEPQDLTPWLKVKRAWFVQGYPKGNLPRLEADITGVVYHPEVKEFPAHSQQLEIKFTNVKEVTAFSEFYVKKRKEYADEAMEKLRQKVTTA
jgi:hypothetical protein